MVRAIVIGAGPAGLAAAACLRREGVQVSILEKAGQVGASWRGHYDSLRLHTSRGNSGLPDFPMPASVGRYAKRDDVVAYLEAFAAHHGLTPGFDTEVTKVSRRGDLWRVQAGDLAFDSEILVVAAGMTRHPFRPVWQGQEDFGGKIIHSSAYKSASPYAGQRVLVVGFGNSGGDIARDLADAGVAVDMSVRGPVNILPKELFGLPITSFGVLQKILPYRVADVLTAPVLRLVLGRPQDYGLQAAGKGPMAQVVEDGRIPLIDTGTLKRIKAGQIKVRPAIAALEANGARFADGQTGTYDTLICATGYRADLRDLLGGVAGVLDDAGAPLASGTATAARGLYFCSYWVSPNGQLAQAAREAEAIVVDMREKFLAKAAVRA